MRQLGVPVGTTKDPLVKKLNCTLSPDMKLLFSGACRRTLMSVTEPMVVEETKVTWACLISGVVCMFTPSQRPKEISYITKLRKTPNSSKSIRHFFLFHLHKVVKMTKRQDLIKDLVALLSLR
jgi:hypothetical protein